MFEQFIKMPHVAQRLKKSRYKTTLDNYANYLIEKGYSVGSIRRNRNSVEHFFNWLELINVFEIEEVNRSLINQFINEHVPVCQCPIPAPKRREDLSCGLNALSKILKDTYQAPKEPTNELDKLINELDDYLKNVCGLAEKTRWYHRIAASKLLEHFFHNRSLDFKKMNPENVRGYIYDKLPHTKKRTLGLAIYSIRTFFKFLQFNGLVDQPLIDALPRVIEWKSISIPDSLSKDEITKFLNAFDRTSGIDKRDYAMAICILELGLRANEVAQLSLDDMDWRNQVIALTHSKTRQYHLLPMTKNILDSVIDYLKNGRPETNSRYIFVYHRPPVGQGIRPAVVSNMIRRNINRLGLNFSSIGSNLLRRTFATSLLKGGATIKEIADLLRHRSIDTTAIYTKIDFDNLALVALPWPRRRAI